tara:strand:+ start:849 stop:2087 length:1239 start_codon:yes stop_codon:yes gene_type:complete
MFSWKFRFNVALANAFEYYDIAIYSSILIYVSHHFFPAGYFGKSSLFLALVTLALRFLARPLGGVLIGLYADKYSSKKALILTCFLSSLATLCMSCLPTFEQAGLLATVLFCIMQLLQAFAYGGENPVSIVYLMENSTKSERARTGSLIGGLSFLIVALSMGFVTLLKIFLTEDQMYEFGWRVPLLLGLVNLLFGFYFRLKLVDERENEKKNELKNIKLLPIAKVFLITAPSCLLFYTNSICSTVLSEHLTQDKEVSTLISVFSNIIFCIVSISMGYYIDKFRSYHQELQRAYLVMLILGVPVYLLHGLDSVYFILLSQLIICYFISVCISAGPAVTYDHLSKHNKTTTYGIGYNCSAIIFGGFTPMMVTFLSQYGQAYVGLLMSFGGLCYFAALALDKYTQPASAQVSTAS